MAFFSGCRATLTAVPMKRSRTITQGIGLATAVGVAAGIGLANEESAKRRGAYRAQFIWPLSKTSRCDTFEKLALASSAGAASEIPWKHEVLKESQGRSDRHLVLQTLTDGERRIKRLRLFRLPAVADQSQEKLDADAVAGRTRLIATLELGDELNGHPGLIHGGFTAALLDDLFGWTAYMESEHHAKSPLIFTANLSVNYRAPMQADSVYTVELWAEKVVRSKKIYLKALVKNAEGKLCVDSTSLYIIKPR